MDKISWPTEYNDLIPSNAIMILKMEEGFYGSILRSEKFSYFGKTSEKGIAIWLDLTSYPISATCFSLSLSLEEVSDILNRLLQIPLGTGPIQHGIDDTFGSVRISTCNNHEMSMEWHTTKAASWSGVFSLINEIRDKILRSADRIPIPPKDLKGKSGKWSAFH